MSDLTKVNTHLIYQNDWALPSVNEDTRLISSIEISEFVEQIQDGAPLSVTIDQLDSYYFVRWTDRSRNRYTLEFDVSSGHTVRNQFKVIVGMLAQSWKNGERFISEYPPITLEREDYTITENECVDYRNSLPFPFFYSLTTMIVEVDINPNFDLRQTRVDDCYFPSEVTKPQFESNATDPYLKIIHWLRVEFDEDFDPEEMDEDESSESREDAATKLVVRCMEQLEKTENGFIFGRYLFDKDGNPINNNYILKD